MSYARKGPDSDVYVYCDGERYNCAGCLFTEKALGAFSTEDPQDMVHHLDAHVTAGHKVPQGAISRLIGKVEASLMDRPSKALIASDGNGNGTLVWFVGLQLGQEVELLGSHNLGDYGLDNCPRGLHVWEGTYVDETPPDDWTGPSEYIARPHGGFRTPTAEEWKAIQANQCPWPPDFPEDSHEK